MTPLYTAFAGHEKLAEGSLSAVAVEVKRVHDRSDPPTCVVFENATGQVAELDLRGSEADVARAHRVPAPSPVEAPASPPGTRGRPRLGVVGREVTLLPRHWDWLKSQPGSASSTLRRLVEAARLASEGTDRIREAQNLTYAFMTVMVGDHPGFEEATRALYARDRAQFEAHSECWPDDLEQHARWLSEGVFEAA